MWILILSLLYIDNGHAMRWRNESNRNFTADQHYNDSYLDIRCKRLFGDDYKFRSQYEDRRPDIGFMTDQTERMYTNTDGSRTREIRVGPQYDRLVNRTVWQITCSIEDTGYRRLRRNEEREEQSEANSAAP
jgi:hypothetical protein